MRVACGVLMKNEKILITKRPPDVHLGNYWEFPGGKILEQETPEEGLYREMKEELGISVKIVRSLGIVEHHYQKPIPKWVKLYFFLCQILNGKPEAITASQMLWVKPMNLKDFCFPPADKNLIQTLPQTLLPHEDHE